jgi:hypothetical protein
MMLYFGQKLTIAMDLKAWALSVIIFRGQPNVDKMFSSKKLITTESIAFHVRMVSTHLVKLFVEVRIHLCCALECG